VILNGAVAADDWTLIPADPADFALPNAGKIIVPLKRWQAGREALLNRADAVGVWLDSDEDPAELAADIAALSTLLPLIAVNFPAFKDGRGYSTAYLLRQRFGFRGELRAIGDVLRDQLFYLKRVGFNAFAVRADRDIDDALTGLGDFSEVYQGSIDQALPLFRRRGASGLDAKVATLKALLKRIEGDFAPAAFATSFGAEDMVLLDLIAREFPGIEVFTLETGRLPQATHDLIARAGERYSIPLQIYYPNTAAIDEYVKTRGQNAFYESLDNRKDCCAIRKVEPLKRALAGKKAWLTGLRREQAASRNNLAESGFDEAHGLTKFNPLIDWTAGEVWAYLRANDVPYNALHDKGYPSIGCEPCTRAVKPGEDPRAGRWWWEGRGDQKECGLHPADGTAHSIPRYASIAINVTEKESA
jgi:phosphoadenosine phosphosulfate reductase